MVVLGMLILAVDFGILCVLVFGALRRPDSRIGTVALRLWAGCFRPDHDVWSIAFLGSIAIGTILIGAGLAVE